MKYMGCLFAAFFGALAGFGGTVVFVLGCLVVTNETGEAAANSALYGGLGITALGALTGIVLWWKWYGTAR